MIKAQVVFREKKIAVVMPAHNEARLIERAIGQVPSFVDHLVVVDDCSTDGTADVVRGLAPGARALTLISHDENRGVGAAIISGYRAALDLGVDVVAVMAGDAQMDPADLPRLISPIAEGRADYSKGDRLSWPGVVREMPFIRFVGNHVLTAITRLTSGYRDVRDSQCGYTAASASLLREIDLDALYPRYGYPNDFLALLKARDARLAQVPVRPVYGDEVSGISFYTAFVRVPLVLLRSHVRRRQWRRLALDRNQPWRLLDS